MNIEELKRLDGYDSLAISAEEGQILHDLIIERDPFSIVEIGTGKGYSTAWIASTMDNNGIIISVDIKRRDSYCFSENSNVRTIISTLEKCFNQLPLEIDFLFLDSDHQIDMIVKDVELLLPRLTKDATVVVHDTIYCEEMGKCLKDYFEGVESDRLKTIPLKPSNEKWTYEEKKTQYGLGIARRGEGK